MRTPIDDAAPAATRSGRTGSLRSGTASTDVAIVAVAAAAAGLSLFATRSGPRATQDSANYLAMAASLTRDGSLLGVGGRPVTVFPPGYPALLAAGDALLGRGLWLRLLPALCAAVAVVSTAALVRRHVRDPRFAVLAGAAVAVSPALGLVWMTTWSEGPFVAALAVFLLAADVVWSGSEGRGRRWWSWVVVAVVAGWAMCALRYVGVVAVPVLGLTVGLRATPRRWRGVGEGIGAAAAVLVAPVAVVARNLAVDGSAMGVRTSSVTAPLDALRSAAATLLAWVVPGSVLLGAAVVLAVALWAGRPATRGSVRAAAAVLAPACWTAGFAAAFLLVSSLTTSLDGLDDRMLSILVVPLVAILVVAADGVVVRSDDGPRAARVLLIGSSAWVALLAGAAAVTAAAPPVSLSPARFDRSEVMAAARELPESTGLVSNRPEVVSMATGRRAVGAMPSATPRGWEPADPDASALRRFVACSGGSVVVAWFDDVGASWIGPEQLPPPLDVEELDRLADGRTLRISSADAADDCPSS